MKCDLITSLGMPTYFTPGSFSRVTVQGESVAWVRPDSCAAA